MTRYSNNFNGILSLPPEDWQRGQPNGTEAMPLKLSLAKGEKMVVNGAVIRNDGADANLVFENHANILRHKDILTPNKATTPASRVYLALQCAYMFADTSGEHLQDFRQLLADFSAAAPSSMAIVQELLKQIEAGNLYGGLKLCRELVDYEAEVLANVA